MLDQLSALVKSVPKEKLSDLLDESFHAFNGAGYDLGSLLDSGSRIAADSNATAERTRTLIDDTAPLLDSQVQSADALRIWAHSLSGSPGRWSQNDPRSAHRARHRTRHRGRGFATARSDQADAAGAAGEPDLDRRGGRDIQPVAGAAAGAAAAVRRWLRFAVTDEQPGRSCRSAPSH